MMAQGQVEVMQRLGFREFAVVGHDQGARVAHPIAQRRARAATQTGRDVATKAAIAKATVMVLALSFSSLR
jgi:hypothetical protein